MRAAITSLLRHARIKALSTNSQTLYLRALPLCTASGHVSDADLESVLVRFQNAPALMRELAESCLLIENSIAHGYLLSLPETLDGAELFAWGHERAWADDTAALVDRFSGRVGAIDDVEWSAAMDELGNDRGKQ